MSATTGRIRVKLNLKIEVYICVSLLLTGTVSLLAGCRAETDSSIDAVVSGNSMAPAFWGEHVQVECGQCKYPFRIGCTRQDLPGQLVCPNCGFREIDSSEAVLQSAQRVQIQDRAGGDATPKFSRWDVVAIRANDRHPAMIKRIVGLPGESLSMIDGDIYADGKIVRKSIDIARQMRVPVFDSQFSSTSVLRRLQPSSNATDWQVVDSTWIFSPASQRSKVTQWLAYQQWRCVSSSMPRDHPALLEDWYAANLDVNRNLHSMSDAWVSVDFQVEEGCQFVMRLIRGAGFLDLEFDCSAETISFNDRSYQYQSQLARSAGGFGSGSRSLTVDVCTFDRRMTVLVDGTTVASVELPPAGKPDEVPPIVQIGGRDSSLTIDRFRIWRDVHYFDVVPVRGNQLTNELRAGEGEYLLVGDNVPISVDSRHWPVPTVSADEIIGVVSRSH